MKKRTWLYDIRKAAGLTTYLAAERCGISQSYYFSIESGQRGDKLPVETAMKIATGLGFDWKLFYEDPDAAAI